MGGDSYEMIANKYDNFKEKENSSWQKLPQSVIGTLLYFLIIELNSDEFYIAHFFQCLLVVGLPSYFTYMFQGTILYELWSALTSFQTDDGADLCGLPTSIEFAAIAVFAIVLWPSVADVLHETMIVMFSDRVAYLGEADEGKITIHKLHSTFPKRIATWIFVCLFEVIILIAMILVGVKFM
jgi:hypothetical protein